jgi:hypothetical protein
LSKYRFAVDLCGNCDSRIGTSIGWSANNTISASVNAGVFKSAFFHVAKPRAAFTNGMADIGLEYFDSTTLTAGSEVHFESTCTLPSPLQASTTYYILAADTIAKSIQISAAKGGAAISAFVNNTGCAYQHHFLLAEGFASSTVSVSANAFSLGDTVNAVGNALPYPLVDGNSYYVAGVTSVVMGGASYQPLTLKASAVDGSPIVVRSPSARSDNRLERVAAAGSPIRNWEGSAFTTLNPSGNNLYYAAATDKAFCAMNQTHGGSDTQGSCALSQSALNTQESNSVIANPALDYESTGRATAATPLSAWNKGVFSGMHSATPGATAAVLEFKAPSAGDSCSIAVFTDSALTNQLESHSSTAGARRRTVILGAAASLTPDTDYWYKVQCGYDVVTAAFRTSTIDAGTGILTVNLGERDGVVSAVLETSADGADWTPGTEIACASGCRLLSPPLAKNNAVWYRWRTFAASGAENHRSVNSAAIVR